MDETELLVFYYGVFIFEKSYCDGSGEFFPFFVAESVEEFSVGDLHAVQILMMKWINFAPIEFGTYHPIAIVYLS